MTAPVGKTCVDCGASFLAKAAAHSALYCGRCRRERRRLANKRHLLKKLTNDPDYNKPRNAYKNAWYHKKHDFVGPQAIPCYAGCGTLLPKRGRTSRAMCPPCSLENRQYVKRTNVLRRRERRAQVAA